MSAIRNPVKMKAPVMICLTVTTAPAQKGLVDSIVKSVSMNIFIFICKALRDVSAINTQNITN